MTKTETSIAEEQRIGNQDNSIRHYIRKSDFEKAVFFGVPPKALCGAVLKIPLRDPAGKPICRKCQELWELLPEE